jgi:hypothetical protein
LLAVFVVAGCTEDSATGPAAPPAGPSLAALLPPRTVAGDTLRIEGQNLGDADSGEVLFATAGGSIAADAILDWSAESVTVLVPAGVASGPIRVRVGDADSNELAFELAPRIVSYATDVDPIFAQNGCKGCHGGNGGLFLTSRETLLRGDSNNGPVVIPRQSADSVLFQKLTNPPFGGRMPLGGNPLPGAQIQLIADWIDQGTRDN